jgi:hypothetical protein
MLLVRASDPTRCAPCLGANVRLVAIAAPDRSGSEQAMAEINVAKQEAERAIGPSA